MNLENLTRIIDIPLFWEYRQTYLSGLVYNFYVFGLAALLAVTAGFFISLLRLSRNKISNSVGTFYVELFRNAPEYVLLVWVHYVLPLLLTVLLNRKFNFSPLLSAVLALGTAYSGYFAETFRAGIQAIPRAHIESGWALGMSKFLVMRRIILPQAVRQMLPETLNQFVSLFKATTLISLISVPDLMYQVTIITQQEMRPLPLYSSAAIIYFVLIFIFSTLVNMFSEKWRTQGMA
jgi:polar amino acid transport system permease protein